MILQNRQSISNFLLSHGYIRVPARDFSAGRRLLPFYFTWFYHFSMICGTLAAASSNLEDLAGAAHGHIGTVTAAAATHQSGEFL